MSSGGLSVVVVSGSLGRVGLVLLGIMLMVGIGVLALVSNLPGAVLGLVADVATPKGGRGLDHADPVVNATKVKTGAMMIASMIM